MFNFKKIGAAALSLAVLGLMIQGPAAFAETGSLSGSGSNGQFTPDTDPEQAGEWNQDTADADVDVEYTTISTEDVNSLDEFTIDMVVPTSVGFVIEGYSPNPGGTVTVDSKENPVTKELGTIENRSYGIFRDDPVRVDSVVRVVGYVKQGGDDINPGFDFIIYGAGGSENVETVPLVEAISDGNGGFSENRYLETVDGEEPQLAVVAGAYESDQIGGDFKIDYRVNVHLGIRDVEGTIANQLFNTETKTISETGTLTLRYGFRVAKEIS